MWLPPPQGTREGLARERHRAVVRQAQPLGPGCARILSDP